MGGPTTGSSQENKENTPNLEAHSTATATAWAHYIHYYGSSDTTSTTTPLATPHSYNNYNESTFQAYHQHQRQLQDEKLICDDLNDPTYQPVVNYGLPHPPKPPPPPNASFDLSPLCSPCGSPPRLYNSDNDDEEYELLPSPITQPSTEIAVEKEKELSPPPAPPEFPFPFPDLCPPPEPPQFPWPTPGPATSNNLPSLLSLNFNEVGNNCKGLGFQGEAKSSESDTNTNLELHPYYRKQLQRELDQLLRSKSTSKLEPWMLFIIDPDLPQPIIDMCKPFLCKLCGLGLSSRIVSMDHYKGKRHRQKIHEWLRVHRHPLASLFAEPPSPVKLPPPHLFHQGLGQPMTMMPNKPSLQTVQNQPQPVFQSQSQIEPPPDPSRRHVSKTMHLKKKFKFISKAKKKNEKKTGTPVKNVKRKPAMPKPSSLASSSGNFSATALPALSPSEVRNNLLRKNDLLRELLESKIPLPRELRLLCETWHCKLCDVRHFSSTHSADHYKSYRHRLSALRWLEQNSFVPSFPFAVFNNPISNNTIPRNMMSPVPVPVPLPKPLPFPAPHISINSMYQHKLPKQRVLPAKPRTYWNYIKRNKIGFFGHHCQPPNQNQHSNNSSSNPFREGLQFQHQSETQGLLPHPIVRIPRYRPDREAQRVFRGPAPGSGPSFPGQR